MHTVFCWQRTGAGGDEMKTEQYRPDFGEVKFPEGFEEKLKGKSIEEQMNFYRITESRQLARTSYGQVDKETVTKRCYKLTEYENVEGLVVRDGILVGVRMTDWWNSGQAVLPYGCVLTYYASDNEGSGTKDREDYAYLICV